MVEHPELFLRGKGGSREGTRRGQGKRRTYKMGRGAMGWMGQGGGKNKKMYA